MSSDFHHLPIVPAAPSLASHLQALDLLAARLSSLSTRAEWETRVPLNGKASILGKLVNTGTIKINVGGEWWVDMTPQEAEAWIRRRKAALLEEHAKVLEGWRPGQGDVALAGSSTDTSSRPAARFDTVFRSPVNSSGLAIGNTSEVQQEATDPPTRTEDERAGSSSTSKIVKTDRPEESTPQTSNAVAGPSQPRSPTAPPQTIQDVLATFLEKQEALAQSTGKTSIPNGDAGDVMTNEEGLPIHEIREDENGDLIGDLPQSSVADKAGSSGFITEIPEEKKQDFWSDEAAARRAALRRKVFDDSPDDSSDEEDEPEGRHQAALPPTPPESSSSARQAKAVPPSINAIPPTPSSPQPQSPPPPIRRPSSSGVLPGKSILKPSAPRKKSVSFDSSVPEPPDSPAPGPSTTRIGGSMFPTPVINIESGIEEKKVPMLNAPKRSPKRSTFDNPFAGFKPGFLSSGSKSVDSLSPPSPGVLSAEPESTYTPQSVPEVGAEESSGKKPSLFSQRQRADAVDTSNDSALSSATSSTPPAGPSFPALSTSKGTSSMKNVVLEKPPASRPTGTAGVAQTVTERPISSKPGPSRALTNGHTGGSAIAEEDGDDYHEDEDEEDDDDDDFYADDDDEEEEEYDLDDAMLAREVALAYHQNRAYTELGRPRSAHSADNDNDHMLMDDEEDGGGVMMALPEISVLGEDGSGSAPRIINPTPDNLRRFVRVGKLDNGKLVLAPGESGWSDEEEGQDEKKENREEIKRALLGQPTLRERKAQQSPPAAAGLEDVGLPPTIGQSTSAVESLPPTPAVGGVKERSSPDVQVVNQTKKVSRFKADRMGNT